MMRWSEQSGRRLGGRGRRWWRDLQVGRPPVQAPSWQVRWGEPWRLYPGLGCRGGDRGAEEVLRRCRWVEVEEHGVKVEVQG